MDTKAVEFAQKLGARIVQLRKEHSYAQERLATLARMNKGYLSSVESGQRVPSVGMLMKLAKVLQVSIFELFVFPEAGPAERLWEEIRHGGSPQVEQLRHQHGMALSPAAQASGATAKPGRTRAPQKPAPTTRAAVKKAAKPVAKAAAAKGRATRKPAPPPVPARKAPKLSASAAAAARSKRRAR